MQTLLQIRILLITLGMVVFSSSALATYGPSTCDDPETGLFISLSSDDVWRASMALNFAKRNLEFGPVTVFMNITGTRVGVKGEELPHDIYALNKKTTLETLQAFLDAGGKGLVCPMCLKRAGFKEESLIKHKNLQMGQAELVRNELDCSAKQLSW